MQLTLQVEFIAVKELCQHDGNKLIFVYN